MFKLMLLLSISLYADCATTPSQTPTHSHTRTHSRTPTHSDTPTISDTPSTSVSPSPSPTCSPSASPSPSKTPSHTPTPSNTDSPTTTKTISASVTPTKSGTPSNTPTISDTSSVTPTGSLTSSDTPTGTSTPSDTPTGTSTPSGTPSFTPTPSDTPSVTVTPTGTPSRTASHTPTPSHTPTSSITPSFSTTTTLTPSISGTPSTTPSFSATPSITPSFSGTPSQTASITSSRSPSPSATPSPTLPPSTVVLSAMGVGLGGMFTGAVLCQLSLMFLIPFLLTQWRTFGKGGGGGSKPELVSLLDKTDKTSEPPPPPPPPSLEDMEAKRLASAIESTKAKIQGLKRELNGDIMGGGGEEGGGAIPEDPETRALNSLWERGELIKVTSLAIAELSSFCDEVLVDALEEGSSSGVGGEGSTSARLVAVLQGVFECAQATAQATLASPPQSLPMLLCSEEALSGLAATAVGAWVSSSSSGTLGAAVVPRLGDFAKVLIKCTLWAQAVDSNFQWSPLPSTPFPFNPDTHQVFSMDGKTLGVGASVVALSPGLLPRQPTAEGSEPLTPKQLSDLSAKRCKVLVVKAP